ncbi:MAG: hypothetical protein H6734_07090 [Alphaproteobacteria bacterium]|nr:hypothetical protein [Alphaproteobacteria bacterium]
MRFGLVVLLFCGTALAGDWRTMLSPGPMAPAHESLGGNCDACHLSFAGVPDAKCLDCHEGLAARIQSGKSFHATVKGQECIACHADHGGTDASLTRDPARKAFDHASTGFALLGAHAEKSCEDCHTKPVHELGGGCAGCHTDIHSSALGPACSTCHQPIAWTAGLKALTDHRLAMEGKHSQQQCDDCHTQGANLESFAPCANCHPDAHDGVRTDCGQCHDVTGFKPARFDHGPCTCAFPGKHQTVECLACHEGFDFTDTPILCSGCHTQDREHDDLGECSRCHTATSWKENTFDHDRQTTFRIEGAHQAVSCVQCHPGGAFKAAPKACEACHQEQGDTAHGSFGPCATCHVVAAFAPSTFDHATTGFVLSGRHAGLRCPDCHEAKVEGYPGK